MTQIAYRDYANRPRQCSVAQFVTDCLLSDRDAAVEETAKALGRLVERLSASPLLAHDIAAIVGVPTDQITLIPDRATHP